MTGLLLRSIARLGLFAQFHQFPDDRCQKLFVQLMIHHPEPMVAGEVVFGVAQFADARLLGSQLLG